MKAVRGPLTVFAAVFLVSCAGAIGPAPPSPPLTPVSAPPPAAGPSMREIPKDPLELRAALLAAEDERRFDEALFDSAATSGDTAVRLACARALAGIASDRCLPLLRSFTSDSSGSVRAEAAFGMGRVASAESVARLGALLDDSDGLVGRAAALALADIGGDGAEAALAACAGRPGRPARIEALYRLARFPRESAAAAARALARDPNPDVRRAAIYAIARSPLPSSAAVLREALPDRDPDTARWAARALGILGDEASLPDLFGALDRREKGVRIQALAAIAAIEGHHSAVWIGGASDRLASLATTSDTAVALPAISCLRWFVADRGAFRVLNSIASSGIGRRREVAVSAEIAGLGEAAGPKLESALGSGDVGVRVAAAGALAELPGAVADAWRERFFADASPRVREAAVTATPADAGHRELLVAGLGDPDAGVRSAVLDRLAELKEASLLPEFAAALERSRSDTIADAAMSSCAAAAEISGPEAEGLLRKALDFPRPAVVHAARRLLIEKFHADPDSFPAAASSSPAVSEYEGILERAAYPRRAILETTRGVIVVELDGSAAPMTVENFTALAGRHFFDGSPWMRVVPDFVAQGGDPTGTQRGGPGYEIRDEMSLIPYEAGTVGMALSGDDTGGSQFFVTLSRQPHLDGHYPVFGRVIQGMEVAGRLEQGDILKSVTIVGRDTP